ncbi:MAG: M28 family peptidase [Candidatus Aegiribacteria sp.]
MKTCEKSLERHCLRYMEKLCEEIRERSVGSRGNRMAADFFEREISSLGWETEKQEFEAMDWMDGGAELSVGENFFQVFPSPYSIGCDVEEELVGISGVEELEHADIGGKVVLLHGEIAGEQLMPRNFVFYNPEKHRRIISLLDTGKPAAIACATGRNASLAGGVYPFPLIEDGDFHIPSVYMTEEEGSRLLAFAGDTVKLSSRAERIPGGGFNVVARRGGPSAGRIVVTAHIDAKKGTPGAIDNASGVAVLLLMAGVLSEYGGPVQVEIVALNGEDYYAAAGQMLYLRRNRDRFDNILMNINIDGAGYSEGPSAFSFYSLPKNMENIARAVMDEFDSITEGPPWPQGDHSIFIQNGCPAMAVSSLWFTDNIDSQEITHTTKDRIEIVDFGRLADIARALSLICERVSNEHSKRKEVDYESNGS